MNRWVAAAGEQKLQRARRVFFASTSPLIEQMRAVVAQEAATTGREPDAWFGIWLLQADALLRARTGLTLFDLDGSWPWRTAYEDDQHPGRAARAALMAHPRWSIMDLGTIDESAPVAVEWAEEYQPGDE